VSARQIGWIGIDFGARAVKLAQVERLGHDVRLAAALAVAGLGWAAILGWPFLATCAGYLVLNLLYSQVLKRAAFWDVASIAAGFLLRVVGGALAIRVVISPFLLLCTFWLAALLGLGKRHHELRMMREASAQTRTSLAGYNARTLLAAEWVAAVATVLSYLFYTVSPQTVSKFHSVQLVWTLPFPVLGILRYLHLVRSRSDRTPTDALVTDAPSLLNGLMWTAMVVWILYGN
jgi:4-hydroxybenzoate polyprenyltransferase